MVPRHLPVRHGDLQKATFRRELQKMSPSPTQMSAPRGHYGGNPHRLTATCAHFWGHDELHRGDLPTPYHYRDRVR